MPETQIPIKQLVENSESFYPLTSANAVLFDGGTYLSSKPFATGVLTINVDGSQVGTFSASGANNQSVNIQTGASASLNSLVASASYNSNTKKIEFFNTSSTKLCDIDASAFIVDGMIDSVSIGNGTGANAGVSCLLIDFNTDAESSNHTDIQIPLTQIFNPSNYYTKTETDETFVAQTDYDDDSEVVAAALNDLNGRVVTLEAADSGDENVIETVKVNNTALTPDANKAVNITVPTKVSDLNNDSGFTSNTGTITGITMNGASKGTSGVVDLGTVITSHQDISGKESTSNKVTSLSSSSTDTQYPSAKSVYDFVSSSTNSAQKVYSETPSSPKEGDIVYVAGSSTIIALRQDVSVTPPTQLQFTFNLTSAQLSSISEEEYNNRWDYLCPITLNGDTWDGTQLGDFYISSGQLMYDLESAIVVPTDGTPFTIDIPATVPYMTPETAVETVQIYPMSDTMRNNMQATIVSGQNKEYLGGTWVDRNNFITSAVSGVKGDSESSYRTGNVNITAANIGAAASSHAHGWLNNNGEVVAGVTIASGDKLVIADNSSSNKIAYSTISFNGSTTTKALTQKGTFETFLTSHQDISGKANLDSPTFTGTPVAPTAATGTNTTQIATTAFVQNAIPTVTSTYSSTGTDAVNGTAVASALSSYVTNTEFNNDARVVSAALNDLNDRLGDAEDSSNKVTSLSSSSTDTQYPSAKCVYDAIQNSSSEWRLIASNTMTSTATSVSITSDNNSNSFSLTNALVYIKLKNGSSTSLTAKIRYYNSSNTYYELPLVYADYDSSGDYYMHGLNQVRILNGIIMPVLALTSYSSSESGMIDWDSKYTYLSAPTTSANITRIDFIAIGSNNIFGADTEYYVWGY